MEGGSTSAGLAAIVAGLLFLLAVCATVDGVGLRKLQVADNVEACASSLAPKTIKACTASNQSGDGGTVLKVLDVSTDGMLLWASCVADPDLDQEAVNVLLLNHSVVGGRSDMSLLVQLYASNSNVPLGYTLAPTDWWEAAASTSTMPYTASSTSSSVTFRSANLLPRPLAVAEYSAWALTPSALSTLYDNNMLQPLEQLLPLIPSLASYWQDVPEMFRDAAGVYDGHVVSIPYSAEVPLLFWRRDLFQEMGLKAPVTWEEALALAESIHGVKVPCLNDTSQTCEQYGFCFGLATGCFYDGVALSTIWASMVGSYGTRSGLYFDPSNMQPLFTGSAMAEAIRIYRRLYRLGPPGLGPCGRLPLNSFVERCFMGLGLTNSFKQVSFALGGKTRGKLGSSLLPGSHVVQNRTSGQLEPCNLALCPYGKLITSAVHNGTVMINRVPYLGLGAFSFSINRNAAPNHALAAIRAFIFTLTYKDGWIFTTDPGLGTLSVRTSHLSPESIPYWTRAGYNEADTRAFLAVMAESIRHPCLALPMRAPGGTDIASAVSLVARAATANESLSATDLLELLKTHYARMLEARYGNDTSLLREAYQRDIGYNPEKTAVDDPARPPAPSLAPAGARSGGSKLSRGGIRAVAVAAAVVTVVLLLVVAVRTIQRERRLRGAVRVQAVPAPGYSPDSSLCITDIQSSTNLWEELPPNVMDSGLSLHNGCVRTLLSKHQGYECHTEGDSFICAFPTAVLAVNFALELQMALMQLPWPQQILQHPECACVYQNTPKRVPGSGGGVGGGGVGGPAGGLVTSGRSRTAIYLHPLMLFANLHSRALSHHHLASTGASGGGDGSFLSHLRTQSRGMSMTAAVGPDVSTQAGGKSQLAVSISDRAPSYTSVAFGMPYSLDSMVKGLGTTAMTSSTVAVEPSFASQLQLPGRGRASGDNGPGSGRLSLIASEIAAVADAAVGDEPVGGVASVAAATTTDNLMSAATGPVVGPLGSITQGPGAATSLSATTTTLTMAMGSAAGTSSHPASSGQTLLFRGFRVRVGICSGLTLGRDVVYCKDLSRRTAYSGLCMQTTKMISDAGVGGMVLLANSTVERLLPLPRRDFLGLVLWHKGRFQLIDKEKDCSRKPAGTQQPCHAIHQPLYQPLSIPTPSGLFTWTSPACPGASCEIQDLYQAISSSLIARQPLLERLPLRTGAQLLPGILSAPVGNITLALVQVVGVPTLMAWDINVARECLDLLYSTALGHLRVAGGYPAELEAEGGRILAAFASGASAIRWLLILEEDLRCNVVWPSELLHHELGEELVVALPATEEPVESVARPPITAPVGPLNVSRPGSSRQEQRQLEGSASFRGGSAATFSRRKDGATSISGSNCSGEAASGVCISSQQLVGKKGQAEPHGDVLPARVCRLQHEVGGVARRCAAFVRRSLSDNSYFVEEIHQRLRPELEVAMKAIEAEIGTVEAGGPGTDSRTDTLSGLAPPLGTLLHPTVSQLEPACESLPLPQALSMPLRAPQALLNGPLQASTKMLAFPAVELTRADDPPSNGLTSIDCDDHAAHSAPLAALRSHGGKYSHTRLGGPQAKHCLHSAATTFGSLVYQRQAAAATMAGAVTAAAVNQGLPSAKTASLRMLCTRRNAGPLSLRAAAVLPTAMHKSAVTSIGNGTWRHEDGGTTHGSSMPQLSCLEQGCGQGHQGQGPSSVTTMVGISVGAARPVVAAGTGGVAGSPLPPTPRCPHFEASLKGSLSLNLGKEHCCRVSSVVELTAGDSGGCSGTVGEEISASWCPSAGQQYHKNGEQPQLHSHKHVSPLGCSRRGSIDQNCEQRNQLFVSQQQVDLPGGVQLLPSPVSEGSGLKQSPLLGVLKQQHLLRGLRTRCAVEAGTFFHDGSINAARLYRGQHGGRPYTQLVQLCDRAPIGQVVCSSAVGKCIQRAAAAGDRLAQQLLLAPLLSVTAAASPVTTIAATGSVAGHNIHRLVGTGGGNEWETQAVAATVLGTWEASETNESVVVDGRTSNNNRMAQDLEVLPARQVSTTTVWVCSWSRGVVSREPRL